MSKSRSDVVTQSVRLFNPLECTILNIKEHQRDSMKVVQESLGSHNKVFRECFKEVIGKCAKKC